MANPKVLGRVSLSAATPAAVYAPATGKKSTLNIRITNSGAGAAAVDVALSTTVAIDAAGLIATESVPVGGTLEITGIAIDEVHQVVAESDIAGVNAVAYGIEVG